ncbi:MAG: NAD-dependent epimerase/dehydratase family protein [Lachnospiraceae bacterium]|nr:NAD-dependent epimerase/dehydratase family protein [Lachnospiraceae bacterium]
MKRILITGADSYVGSSVERYLLEYNGTHGREMYRIDTISLLDETWKNYDFAPFDTVFHVAGIAHADVGKVTEETKALYYQVNRDLALETAAKAREQGVRQFIYMSSIIVYGESAPVGSRKHISLETPPAPANFYGDSKWQAEKGLRRLETDSFRVAVLRPPMIYGKGSKGNYPVLSLLAGKLPVCPAVVNERSMLYVENLAEFVRLLIDDGRGGIFYPQNAEYTVTAQMIRMIAREKGKKVCLWAILNPLVSMAAKLPGKPGSLVNKAFGNLTIDQDLSREAFDGYQIYSLKESIHRTERQ